MTCNCEKPEKNILWTPIPEYRQPTDILLGENVDCYMQRSGNPSGTLDDIPEKITNRIDNVSITSDLNLLVNEQFKLTPNSSESVATWTISIDNNTISYNDLGLVFNPTTGALTGNVNQTFANKNYKVLITALRANSTIIDSREFNFFPKLAQKDETLKFVWPLLPKGRITSGFGPRNGKMHAGIDIAIEGGVLGDILAACDGTVTRCGPGTGWGNVIFIEHRDSANNLVATTVYGHWSIAYVVVGQKVSAGQKIAKEGNTGVSRGAHLHFELHKGSFRNPVNPKPYIDGQIIEAQNNLIGTPGEPDPSTFTTENNVNRGLTTRETIGKGSTESSDRTACPLVLPNQAQETSPSNPEPSVVPSTPQDASVLDIIWSALNEDSSLTDEDKKYIVFLAKIESNYNPSAKNPTSSARGLYQMIDKIAIKYYNNIDITPTIANRNDAYYATKAMIQFYKLEQKPYWNNFISSGKTQIAGKQLDPIVANRYTNITQDEFLYLIHHDGVGNAINGIDKQGLDYFRKKIREV